MLAFSMSMAYDGAGNLETSVNARTEAALYSYDELDRLQGIFPLANGEPITVTYRANERQRESVTNTSSYTFTYDYDPLGRVARKTYDGFGTIGYGFTLLMDFSYDRLGRNTQIVYPDDRTVVNYDYAGASLERVCEVDDPAKGCDDPSAIFYISDVAYDALGRRTNVSMPPGSRSFQYSASTQRVTEDRFDAVAGSGYWIQRDYGLSHTGHDEVGNLIDVRGGTSEAGDPVVAATYTYDRRNRIESWTRGVTEHYSYDALGNLVGYATASPGVVNQGFGEMGGARPHAVTSSSASGTAFTYTYDADGNRASAIGGGSSRYYHFDWANRLVGVGPSPGSSSDLAIEYDAEGMRISELREEFGQRIYFDEHFMISRFEPSGQIFGDAEFYIQAFGETVGYKYQAGPVLRTESAAAWFLPRIPEPWLPWAAALLVGLSGTGLLVLVMRLELHAPFSRHPGMAGAAWTLVLIVATPPLPAGSGGGGGTIKYRWLITDHLGSGVVWVDEAGLRVRHTEYAPFGKVDATTSGSGVTAPQIYAGHQREKVTGFSYMKARWMDSQTGTFVSVDPVVPQYDDPQSLNAFAYGGNNPVSKIDPTGMAQMDCYGNCGGFMYFSGSTGSFTVPFTAAQTGIVSSFAAKFDAAGGSVSFNGVAVSFGGSFSGGGVGGAAVLDGAARPTVDVGSLPSGSGFPGDPIDNRTANALFGESQGPASASAGIFGNPVLNALGKVFALPYTLIGGIAGAVGLAFGARGGFGNNAIEFTNFPWISRAGTLGNVIFYPRGTGPGDYFPAYDWYRPINVGLHERAHTFQYQVLGPLFLPAYLLSGGAFAASSPFERAANRFADGGGGFFP